jgi:DNA-3-methyladenine glycosylase I
MEKEWPQRFPTPSLLNWSIERCPWADGNDMTTHHDEGWGVPEHNAAKLLEIVTPEGAQAGLSWQTILRRREGYRGALANFDPKVVAIFISDDVDRLVLVPSII